MFISLKKLKYYSTAKKFIKFNLDNNLVTEFVKLIYLSIMVIIDTLIINNNY